MKSKKEADLDNLIENKLKDALYTDDEIFEIMSNQEDNIKENTNLYIDDRYENGDY